MLLCATNNQLNLFPMILTHSYALIYSLPKCLVTTFNFEISCFIVTHGLLDINIPLHQKEIDM